MTVRTDLAIAAPLSAARPRPSARMAPAEGPAEAGAPAATRRGADARDCGSRSPTPPRAKVRPRGWDGAACGQEIETPLPVGEGFGVREIPCQEWLRTAPAGLVRFILAGGGALGVAAFWLAPVTVSAFSGHDQAIFGAILSLLDPLPLNRVDVHQHPPRLHEQHDPVPRDPQDPPAPVHPIRPPRPARGRATGPHRRWHRRLTP